MGQVSQTLGQGVEIHFEGKDYVLSPWTVEIQGTNERYLEGEATKAAERQGQFLSREKARQLLVDVNRDITAGLYTFGQEEAMRSLDCARHLAKLTHLMLQANDPTVPYAVAQRLVEHDWEKLVSDITRANADPTKAGTPPA